MMTGTGVPLSSVGVNTHCFTASSAAASSSAIDRSTFASCTRPSGPIVASMITTPCTRADCAIDGYTGLTSFVFVGGLMLPPTRTAAGGGGGGGGGGGASARPPTMPPATPPAMPPSTPPTAFCTPRSSPVSGRISLGASTGAADGFTSIGLGAWGAAACGGAAATNAFIIAGGTGRTSAAIKGMMTTATRIPVCTMIESGTVYQLLDPTLIDGSTMSPNMSCATAVPPRNSIQRPAAQSTLDYPAPGYPAGQGRRL